MPYLGGEETVRELRRALSNPNVQSDQLRYRNTILKVIRAMSQGVDMSGLFSEMVKACATVDVVQKKLVYVFLCSYATLNPELSLLVINTLRKDCQDPNPMVRSLALRNMTNLRLPSLVEYVEQPLTAGLRDRAACVRRVAVLGWAKLHHLQPSSEIDAAVVNELYSLLRDPDPVVMVNCLRALEEILKDEGGVAINKPITHHLLNRSLLLRSIPGLMGAHYKRFFCGYAEPAYIKQRKMQVLVELVNDENVAMLLDELKGYCTDVNADTAQAAISAIGKHTIMWRYYVNPCKHFLVYCGRQALLWLLGVYGERVFSAPYTLEVFIDGVRSEASVGVKVELLTATMRLFLCRPAETQDMLGRLLHYCIEEETDMCVRDQALLYYRLLHCGIEETRKVLQGRRSDPSLGVLIGRPAEPISQWARSFNTLEPLRQSTIETESASRGSPEHTTFDPKPNADLSDTLNCSRIEKVHSDGDGRCSDSSADVLASGVAAPLSLSLSPALSPEEFERLWLQRRALHAEQGTEEMAGEEEDFVWLEECIRCPAIPNCSPQSLQAAMQLVNIQTLAFTPPQTLPWRVYLYTHTCSTDTPHSTLILGELLYANEELQKADVKKATDGKVGVEGTVDEQVEMEATADRGQEAVKVTLRQQPRDDEALKGFLSILTTVLHTLSSERA
ncbi:AP-4 complex subunit beta-1 [Stegastes partitus]|uniref:AP-4 complex subunit beta-1 n=1 Tax=Stegastes partitus TaxID=144197 RepID=A0A9Y4NRM7_9TELE|nr:PREDICTED: AP-4 complex subunit beta-1 [Stegastes partitus]